MRMKLTLAAVLAFGLGAVGTADANTPAPIKFTSGTYWSESYTERIVLKKVRIPCLMVLGGHGAQWWGSGPACDLKSALSDVARAEKEYANADKCGAFDPAACKIQAAAYLGDAETRLGYVREGLKLATANCTGTGAPDSTGYRFSTFRCKVTNIVFAPAACVGNGCHDTKVSGRIAVWPTGRASLRWKLI